MSSEHEPEEGSGPHGHDHTPSTTRIPPYLVKDCIPHADTSSAAELSMDYTQHPSSGMGSAVREGAIVFTKEGIPRHVNRKETQILKYFYYSNLAFACLFMGATALFSAYAGTDTLTVSTYKYVINSVQAGEHSNVPTPKVSLEKAHDISVNFLVIIGMLIEAVVCLSEIIFRFKYETCLLDCTDHFTYLGWSITVPFLNIVIAALGLMTESFTLTLLWMASFAFIQLGYAHESLSRPVPWFWMMISTPSSKGGDGDKFPLTKQNKRAKSGSPRPEWDEWALQYNSVGFWRFFAASALVYMAITIVQIINYANGANAYDMDWYIHASFGTVLATYFLITVTVFMQYFKPPSQYLMLGLVKDIVGRVGKLVIYGILFAASAEDR